MSCITGITVRAFRVGALTLLGAVAVTYHVGCGAPVANGVRGVPRAATLEKLPAPSVGETGGAGTQWYLRYVMKGGFCGATVQVLVITTNPQLSEWYVPPLSVPADDVVAKTWREAYLVSERTANEIEGLLDNSRFFDWGSAPRLGADVYEWDVVARVGGRAHAVRLEEFDEALRGPVGQSTALAEFQRGGARGVLASDSEQLALAKGLFNLVDQVRSIARAQGRALSP